MMTFLAVVGGVALTGLVITVVATVICFYVAKSEWED
jgi:hypothetical protein